MYRPAWFDTMVQYQPAEPPKAQRSNLQPLEYAEDRLLAVLAKKHPELWLNTIVNMVPDELGHIDYVHPASAFVERQKQWISRGRNEEEAYEKTLLDWQRQRRLERIELQVAMLQAEARGAEIEVESAFDKRRDERFEEALSRRMNLEQQRRRERLEALLETRDEEGESEPIDLTSLGTIMHLKTSLFRYSPFLN